jgi:hypothetical protein
MTQEGMASFRFVWLRGWITKAFDDCTVSCLKVQVCETRSRPNDERIIISPLHQQSHLRAVSMKRLHRNE